MNVEHVEVQCPYCGEMIEIGVEPSSEEQNYIQDCSVCCRPIQFDITPGEGDEGPDVHASRSE